MTAFRTILLGGRGYVCEVEIADRLEATERVLAASLRLLELTRTIRGGEEEALAKMIDDHLSSPDVVVFRMLFAARDPSGDLPPANGA